MYFTIGGHPAFRVPVREGESQSDYRLAFEGLDVLTYLLIDTSAGTVIADEPHTLSLENGTCSIAPHMFDKDALVFDNGQIQKAGILFPDGPPYLTHTTIASMMRAAILFTIDFCRRIIYYSVCVFILVLGLSYATSAIVIFFRDLTQIINIVLQVGVWLVMLPTY